jgi:hypothetical protein
MYDKNNSLFQIFHQSNIYLNLSKQTTKNMKTVKIILITFCCLLSFNSFAQDSIRIFKLNYYLIPGENVFGFQWNKIGSHLAYEIGAGKVYMIGINNPTRWGLPTLDYQFVKGVSLKAELLSFQGKRKHELKGSFISGQLHYKYYKETSMLIDYQYINDSTYKYEEIEVTGSANVIGGKFHIGGQYDVFKVMNLKLYTGVGIRIKKINDPTLLSNLYRNTFGIPLSGDKYTIPSIHLGAAIGLNDKLIR